MAEVALIAVATFASIKGKKEQAKQARRAASERKLQNAINNKQQQVARQRNIRQLVARSRVLAAQQIQAGVTQGLPGASAIAGTTGAIRGDLATSIGAANIQQAAAVGISQSQGRETDFLVAANSPNRFTNIAAIAGGALQAFSAVKSSASAAGLGG